MENEFPLLIRTNEFMVLDLICDCCVNCIVVLMIMGRILLKFVCDSGA